MNELLSLLNETITAHATAIIALCTVIQLWRPRNGNVENEISKPILRMEDDDHWKD